MFSSDYDLAVISADFATVPKYERTFRLLGMWDADAALEAVAFTPRELDMATGMLVWDILEEGLVIKDAGVFARRKTRHEGEKARGVLKKVEKGWKFVGRLPT